MTTVQTISYQGQELPVRISYYCIKKFTEETGKDLDAIDTDVSLLEVLLWYGLVAGHKAEGKDFLLKREDMEFVLDESMLEFNEIMMNFFPLAGPSAKDSKKK